MVVEMVLPDVVEVPPSNAVVVYRVVDPLLDHVAIRHGFVELNETSTTDAAIVPDGRLISPWARMGAPATSFNAFFIAPTRPPT
jgi:hypothetical protein